TGFDYAGADFGGGLASEYLHTQGANRGRSGHFRTDFVSLSAYGTYLPPDLKELSFYAIGGAGYVSSRFHREAGPSGSTIPAIAKPNGLEANAVLGAEFTFAKEMFARIPEGFSLTPLANVQYVWNKLNSFQEHGAGVYDLKAGRQIANSLSSLLGTRADYFFENDSVALNTEFDLGWRYEFLHGTRHVTLATPNFTQIQNLSSQSVRAARNTLWVGFDLLLTVYRSFQLEASSDLQWNPDYIQNSFYLGLGGAF
ncbi:MAG: autotransporter outer membrane beta-barrel domain-containing protein, partial [Chlamydiales bacterium]